MVTMSTRISFLLTLAVVLALPLATDAQDRRRSNSSTSVDGDRAVADCRDIRVTFDRRPAITAEAQMTLTLAQGAVLRASASNNGIYVTGWDRNEVSVKTCKAVADNDPNPTATLREITTSNSQGRISVDGPSARECWPTLLIMVPRLSALDLQTANGPLQLKDLAGVIQLRAANGPIGLDNVGGSVQATTANGPINVKNSNGDHRLSALNGPIHIALSGSRWEGPGLEASTQKVMVHFSVAALVATFLRRSTGIYSTIGMNLLRQINPRRTRFLLPYLPAVLRRPLRASVDGAETLSACACTQRES